MSKVALTPDLARDMRDIMKRLDALEAQYSGPRIYGPFTVTTAAIAPLTEGIIAYTHGLGVTPTLVFAEIEDGSFSGYVSWRVTRSSTQVTFNAANNHHSQNATAIFRFLILV